MFKELRRRLHDLLEKFLGKTVPQDLVASCRASSGAPAGSGSTSSGGDDPPVSGRAVGRSKLTKKLAVNSRRLALENAPAWLRDAEPSEPGILQQASSPQARAQKQLGI